MYVFIPDGPIWEAVNFSDSFSVFNCFLLAFVHLIGICISLAANKIYKSALYLNHVTSSNDLYLNSTFKKEKKKESFKVSLNKSCVTVEGPSVNE